MIICPEGTPYQRHLTTSVTTMQSIDLDSLQVAKQRISLFRTDPLKELHNYPARGRPVEAGARPQSVHLRSKQWASRYLVPLDPEGLYSVQSEGCWLVESVLPARSWHLHGIFRRLTVLDSHIRIHELSCRFGSLQSPEIRGKNAKNASQMAHPTLITWRVKELERSSWLIPWSSAWGCSLRGQKINNKPSPIFANEKQAGTENRLHFPRALGKILH